MNRMPSNARESSRLRALSVALAVVALLAPRAASACAVCIASGSKESALGFLWGTLIMLPLPFLVIGGVIWFVWRRVRNAEPGGIRSTEPGVIRSTSSPS